MDTEKWTLHQAGWYELKGSYPGSRIELRKSLTSEEQWSAFLTNEKTNKVISLDEYGALEGVAAAVERKTADPFEEEYNHKLRIIGIVPKRSFERMHAVGAHAWGGAWYIYNELVRNTLSDYGVNPFENKELSTALAFAVCERMHGKPEIKPLPEIAPSAIQDISIEDAIELLDGHAVLPEPFAIAVCKALGVTFNYKLLMMWNDAAEAAERYDVHGVTFRNGVWSLDLSYDICEQIGIEAPGRKLRGKGFQGKANQEALRTYFHAICEMVETRIQRSRAQRAETEQPIAPPPGLAWMKSEESKPHAFSYAKGATLCGRSESDFRPTVHPETVKLSDLCKTCLHSVYAWFPHVEA